MSMETVNLTIDDDGMVRAEMAGAYGQGVFFWRKEGATVQHFLGRTICGDVKIEGYIVGNAIDSAVVDHECEEPPDECCLGEFLEELGLDDGPSTVQ